MKRNLCIGAMFLGFLVTIGMGTILLQKRATIQAAAVQAPMFEVDPLWP